MSREEGKVTSEVKQDGGDFVEITPYWFPRFRQLVGHGLYVSVKDEKRYKEDMEKFCKDIDSDCNDCAHFQRGSWLSKGVCSGTCSKFSKSVMARPNFYSGNECYVPRK